MTSVRYVSRDGARSATNRTISSYRFGYSVAKARSSSSHLTVFMPSRWASGASTSSVSRALRSCLAGGRKRRVRMLCNRSASLITSTRGSRAIATTILRIVSASAASPNLTLSSLVTPSTRCATSAPNSASMSFSADAGVFDRVVQQRGDEGRGVHAQLGQDRRHRERVGDVGVAALAQLAAVGQFGDVVTALQQPGVDLRVGAPVAGQQRLEDGLDDGLAGRVGQAPGQPVADPAAVQRAFDRSGLGRSARSARRRSRARPLRRVRLPRPAHQRERAGWTRAPGRSAKPPRDA